MRSIGLWIAFLPAMQAQPVGGGLKGGVPLSDAFRLSAEPVTADRPQWLAGPFIEFRLPARFAIEVDTLYEGLRFDYRFGRPGLAEEISTTTASTWQLPLLLKYRFSDNNVRPFLSGGVAAYRIGGVTQSGELITQLPSEIRSAINRVGNSFVNGGGVVGGGVEFKAGPLRIAPEVRFTRWAIEKSVGTSDVSLRLNQARTQVMVGIGF
ncbi:MAG: outer membrane beta-barrel protein [Bryobacteraceae bacterium]